MSNGFIPIRRSLFKHFLFKEGRTFSRFEAWLDLIQMASFTDENAELINGKLMARGRGEIIASLRFLMKRWNWSMSKVADFLELLRSQEMVVVDKTGGVTKILLVNFEKHNEMQEKNSKGIGKKNSKTGAGSGLEPNKGSPTGTQTDTPRDHPGISEGTNIKKGKEGNEGEGDGAGAPVYTKEEEDMFIGFKEWISKNAPNVAKMKEPFSIDQYLQLRAKLKRDQVQDLLMKMHNWKQLLQKNVSAYLTILNWSKNPFNQNENPNNGGQHSSVNERLKAALAAKQGPQS